MRVQKQLVVVATLAIALFSVGGIAVVAFNENETFPKANTGAAESSVVTSGADSTETIHRSTKRKIVLPNNDKHAILVDVPDDQIDHADLEEFIEKRPLEAYRIVSVDSDALRAMIRQVDQQPKFELQLLSTSPVNLIAKDAEEHSDGWQAGLATWRGTVAGDDYSSAMFVVSPDGSVHGKINSRDSGRIAIEQIPNTPYHIVWRLQKGFEQIID